MSQDQVLVPPEVYDGLESLHEAGKLDPEDRQEATRVAAQDGYEYVEEWLENVDDEIYADAACGDFTVQDSE